MNFKNNQVALQLIFESLTTQLSFMRFGMKLLWPHSFLRPPRLNFRNIHKSLFEATSQRIVKTPANIEIYIRRKAFSCE